MTGLISQYGFCIVLFPLLGAVVNGFFGSRLQRQYGERGVAFIACGALLLAFLCSLAIFFAVQSGGGQAIVNRVYTWIAVGSLLAEVSVLFDPLSSVMLLIITGIGFLIHVYSAAYMHGDRGFPRYFSYLNLFVFSMLVLVLADNALLMFVGWEGVGLCSYLLIGFWFHEKANTIAANKAFIVNRVGDFGFILGLLLLFWTMAIAAGPITGTENVLSFSFLRDHASVLQNIVTGGVPIVTVICLCLFIGATGKSAQIPLYVWLPDAMAGPTPVSALIHAATMVTAGIYMICRLNFLFLMSDTALAVIAVTGAATALFAATMGCVQNDIKKVLAYSTVSQLGYMFLALGVGAFSAGMFHVVTHAFFKACLFLGAGSVILGMHHEQDIRRMGGLRQQMPLTFTAFSTATLAIMGIPPLSGFFSKDEILWKAFSSEHGHPLLWLAGLLAAGITAFYMTRLLLLVFFGKNRRRHAHTAPTGVEYETHGHDDAHAVKESPRAITTPVLILAFLSLIAGFAGLPASLGGTDRFGEFLGPVLGLHTGQADHGLLEYALMAASLAVVASGSGIAVLFYVVRPEYPSLLAEKLQRLHALVLNKYYVDEVIRFLFVGGTLLVSRVLALVDRYGIDLFVNLSGFALRTQSRLAAWFDVNVVDGAVRLTSGTTLAIGDKARAVQTGKVQIYVLVLILVVAAGIVLKMAL